jgi:hypothetical protein
MTWIAATRGNHTALSVLIALAFHSGSSAFAFPSIATLIEDTTFSRSRVYAGLLWLRKAGLVEPGHDRFGRKGWYLNRRPKVVALSRNAGRKNPVMRDEKIPQCGTLYKVREQTNEQTMEQTTSQARRERPADMKKIVGPIRKTTPNFAAPPSEPRRKLSPRDQTLRELESWFSQKCFAPLEQSGAQYKRWNWLLERFANDHEQVRSVCLEAFTQRSKLCTDEFPVWSLHTVLFYVRFKRKEVETPSHEKVLKSHVFGSTVVQPDTLRQYIAMHGLSEQDVRRVLVGSLYEQLYPQDCNGH